MPISAFRKSGDSSVHGLRRNRFSISKAALLDDTSNGFATPHPRAGLNCVCQIRSGKSFLNITDSVTDTNDAEGFVRFAPVLTLDVTFFFFFLFSFSIDVVSPPIWLIVECTRSRGLTSPHTWPCLGTSFYSGQSRGKTFNEMIVVPDSFAEVWDMLLSAEASRNPDRCTACFDVNGPRGMKNGIGKNGDCERLRRGRSLFLSS